MRKVVFATALFFTLATAAIAQPQALFLTQEHDFGQINEIDGPVSVDFLVVNTGTEKLFFKEVKPSCGCTEPDWTKDSIAPGDTGFIRAKFNPANLPGPFSKIVHVELNGRPYTNTLLFSGTVIPKPVTLADRYPFEHGQIRMKTNYIPFNSAYMGDMDSIEFVVYNQGDKDIYIKKIMNVPAYINFEMPNMRLRAGQETMITAKFNTKASKKWGEHHFVFYLNTTDSIYTSDVPLYSQIHILERFPQMSQKERDKAPKIQVDAQMLYLGKILKGDTIGFEYRVTNMGKKKLEIRAVNTTCGCTASAIDKTELKQGESTIIRGTFNSEGRDGPQEKYIYIVSNDPVSPELRIGFTAEVVTNPNSLKY